MYMVLCCRVAVGMNVVAVQKMLKLCRNFKHLQVGLVLVNQQASFIMNGTEIELPVI